MALENMSFEAIRKIAAAPPPFKPGFIPKNSPVVYRVEVEGEAYDAPASADGGSHVNIPNDHVFMDPLPLDQFYCFQGPERTARILESRVDQVRRVIFQYRKHHFPFAYILMAWHLVDDDTCTIPMSDELDFRNDGFPVWAVVLVFRNLLVLQPHMFESTFETYITCFYQLVNILASYGVHVHVSHYP